MEKFKEAVLKFASSNPRFFSKDRNNSYLNLIDLRFSEFFLDFQTPNHPPYAAMIHRAILELNEKEGASEESISKYIEKEYDDLPWAHSTLLKHHLEKLCDCEEIYMTHKQHYSLSTADNDLILRSETEEKQLKRKQKSEMRKKIDKPQKKCKKKDESRLILEDTHNQIIEVFQEQGQIQVLNEANDEPEKVTRDDLHEPPDLMIQDEIKESEIHANFTEENQSENGELNVGEKAIMITNFGFDGNENHDAAQVEMAGTKKSKLKSVRRSSRLSKKHEINDEIELQPLNGATFHSEIAKSDSSEQQDQITEYNIQIREKNSEDGVSVDAEAQNSPEMAKMCHNFSPPLLEDKRADKGVRTRSQSKTIMEKDAVSELTKSPDSVDPSKDKLQIVAYLPEEKEQGLMIVQEKEVIESHEKRKTVLFVSSPRSEEKKLLEYKDKQKKKLLEYRERRKRKLLEYKDKQEKTELPESMQMLLLEYKDKRDQEPNEKDEQKYKGRGRRPKPKEVNKDDQGQNLTEDGQSQPQYKGRGRPPKRKELEKDDDDVLRKSKCAKKGQKSTEDGQSQPQYKGRGRPPKRKEVEKDGQKSTEDGESQPQYKGRGRPPKPKEVVEKKNKKSTEKSEFKKKKSKNEETNKEIVEVIQEEDQVEVLNEGQELMIEDEPGNSLVDIPISLDSDLGKHYPPALC